MRESLQDQPLEKRNIEIEPATSLYRQPVVVDLRTKLSAKTRKQPRAESRRIRNTDL